MSEVNVGLIRRNLLHRSRKNMKREAVGMTEFLSIGSC